jgi:hypothetical protein
VNLDTFYLKRDEDIIKSNAFGECHIKCLQGSPWRFRWRSRIIENIRDVRGFAEVATLAAGYSVFWNPRLREFATVDAAGALGYVRADLLADLLNGGTEIQGIVLYEVLETLRLDLSSNGALLGDLLQRGGLGGEGFLLIEMIDRLSLAEHILNRLPLEGGRVWVKDVVDTTLYLMARYNGFLPQDVYQSLVQVNSKGRSK